MLKGCSPGGLKGKGGVRRRLCASRTVGCLSRLRLPPAFRPKIGNSDFPLAGIEMSALGCDSSSGSSVGSIPPRSIFRWNHPWSSVRIVIVEDHLMFREVLRKVCVQELQHEVVGEAQDGLKAVEIVAATKPDLVLLDLYLPSLDGFGVVEAIR